MRFGYSNIAMKRAVGSDFVGSGEVATYKGITIKTLFFLLMTVVGAIGGIALGVFSPGTYVIVLAVSSILTFILALISMFSIRACKITGTLYCLAEGTLVGAISMLVATVLEGAVTVALLSTIAVFAVVATLYVSNIVKVTNKFYKFLSIFAISFLVCLLLISIMSLFGFTLSWGLSLLISCITIFLATLYLFMDLERIRQVVEGGGAKELEWLVSFGLAFTLIWLYVEILRIVVVIFLRNRN